jgi:hypothetical protein
VNLEVLATASELEPEGGGEKKSRCPCA